MGRIVALGERNRVQGYAVAGVQVLLAGSTDEAVDAWRDLPADVAVLMLSPHVAAALGERLGERPDILIAVLP